MAFSEWETPKDFYDAMDREFHFTLDACANKNNHKHKNYFSPAVDSLTQDWTGVAWLNPPYDRKIGLWIEKAYRESRGGTVVVCLIQGRSSDTIWWHDYVMRAKEIRYIKDRIHFGKNGVFTRSNISSVVVVFDPTHEGPPTTKSIDRFGKDLTCPQ